MRDDFPGTESAVLRRKEVGTMMMPEQMSQADLLCWIDQVSFAVTDSNLYLDTHPHDIDALRYFRRFSAMREAGLNVYAKRFGPLTVDRTDGDCEWTWTDAPWPWEGGSC
jgi:spore coat protein JB